MLCRQRLILAGCATFPFYSFHFDFGCHFKCTSPVSRLASDEQTGFPCALLWAMTFLRICIHLLAYVVDILTIMVWLPCWNVQQFWCLRQTKFGCIWNYVFQHFCSTYFLQPSFPWVKRVKHTFLMLNLGCFFLYWYMEVNIWKGHLSEKLRNGKKSPIGSFLGAHLEGVEIRKKNPRVRQ